CPRPPEDLASPRQLTGARTPTPIAPVFPPLDAVTWNRTVRPVTLTADGRPSSGVPAGNGPKVCVPSMVTLYVRVIAVPSAMDRVMNSTAAILLGAPRSRVMNAPLP